MTKKKFSFLRSLSIWSPANRVMLLAVFLSLIGLLFVFEASVAQALEIFGDQYHFVRQQAIWLVIGTIGMVITSFIPPTWYQKITGLIYGASLGLLSLVFFPGIGMAINGAQRWIRLPGFSLQPIEVVKLALVLFFADWLSRHQRVRPFILLTGIPVGLLLLQPDMGSTLIVLSMAFGMLFLAGGSLKKIAWLGLFGLITLLVLVMVSPYRQQRVQTFLNPEADPLGSGFHVRQITLALGSGGWFGQGIGKSRQKFAYIPEVSNDSIFAIVAEETGFIGSALVLGLFLWFIRTLFVIIRQTEQQRYLYLLATGVTIWLVTQIVLNLAAVVVLVPLTGLPLPFFSYGGSALVMLLLAIGVVAAAARYSRK